MNDHTMNMYHNMIEGNRFRSRLDEDDDLCNECEDKIGQTYYISGK